MSQDGPVYDLGIIGGGVAVQMALPSLAAYDKVAIHYLPDTVYDYPEFDFFHDLETMLSVSRVQSLFIATPVATHIEMINLASKAGIPVLLEKPLGLDLEDANKAAQIGNVVIAFRKRFSDVARSIKQSRLTFPHEKSHLNVTWLAPHPGVGHWKASRRSTGGGVCLDIGSHVLDLVEYCMAGITSVLVEAYETDLKTGSDSYLSLSMTLEDGSSASAQIGWARNQPIQCLSFRHADVRLNWHKNAKSSESLLLHNIGPRADYRKCHRSDEYSRMFADFKVFAHGGSAGALASWHDGLRNLKLIGEVLETVDTSRRTPGEM